MAGESGIIQDYSGLFGEMGQDALSKKSPQKNQGGSRWLKPNQGGSRHFETFFIMKMAKNSRTWPGWPIQAVAEAAKAGPSNRFGVRRSLTLPGPWMTAGNGG
jgi:hypothetical protein